MRIAGAAALIRRAAKNYRTQKWYVIASKIYRSCLIPMAVTAAFMGFGVYNACFELLGGGESTYGTYYVYGNHDRQRYVSQPAYTESELAERMQAAGMSA